MEIRITFIHGLDLKSNQNEIHNNLCALFIYFLKIYFIVKERKLSWNIN